MITEYKQRHELYIQFLINESIIPSKILHEVLNHVLFPGGKRFRPILVYILGDMLKISLDVLDVIAASIELTHTYSLIHDDLPAMDDDDLRRGKASCHKAFDEATAILAGDGLQALAIQALLTKLSPLLNASQVIAVTLALVNASGFSGMISGQSLDLIELKKSGTTEAELTIIHQLKTGRMISACAEMVIAAQNEANETIQSALRNYTSNLGLLFQMQDDYLDYYSPLKLGKNRSSDKANDKTTFATLFSKDELKDKIDKQYQVLFNNLQFFDNNENLLEFTRKLQNLILA